jgi:hypothetical protein
METSNKRYRFINSQTGNTLYYYTMTAGISTEKERQQLESIKAEVAVSNGVFLDTIYWEEIKEEE